MAAPAPGRPRHIKIIMLGESGVGKTSILYRAMNVPHGSGSSIGVTFFRHHVEVDGELVVMQLWDTAGEERFRAISKLYFRGAEGALFVYDISRPDTVPYIERWYADMAQSSMPVGPKIPADCVLIGNKTDLREPGVVSTESGERCARKFGMEFKEVCATQARPSELTAILDAMAHRIVRRLRAMESDPTKMESDRMTLHDDVVYRREEPCTSC